MHAPIEAHGRQQMWHELLPLLLVQRHHEGPYCYAGRIADLEGSRQARQADECGVHEGTHCHTGCIMDREMLPKEGGPSVVPSPRPLPCISPLNIFASL